MNVYDYFSVKRKIILMAFSKKKYNIFTVKRKIILMGFSKK